MAKVRKEVDSLFVLRHAQRADKLAATVSSIAFDYQHSLEVHESFNPPLATFAATQNKSNNGYTQAKELGGKVLNYVSQHVEGSTVVLRFHTSPYLRCIETVKLMVDYLVRHHDDPSRHIKVAICVDQVLSEWLNTDLDINYYPPNDNGASLLSTAVQYLNSNLPFNRSAAVSITLNTMDSYKHGNPGPFSESLMQQFSRLSRGVISIIKHTQNTLTPDPDTKDILLLMTHGACVRSIVSKFTGKSLMVEIPLASATLIKPQGSDSRHFYWQVQETDIELRKNIEVFKPVDLYSSKDPFQDIQTTFSSSLSSQLDFKSHVPASKSENYNRIRSQSLLNPSRTSGTHESDSEEDSDDEGISFNVTPSRRSSSAHTDNSRRFRSSSLFGPTLNNPFFENTSTRRSASRQNSFERVKASLRQEEEYVSPRDHSNDSDITVSRYNFSPALTSNNTPRITPNPSSTNLKVYQNIDEDDGIHGEIVPDLAELSSNNSSTTSIPEAKHEIPTTFTTPASIPTMKEEASASSSSLATIQPSGASTSLFDKSLIEESLKEIHQEKSPSPVKADWMNFKTENSTTTENKFKIDLYGKKNRTYKLSLYDDDDEDEGSGGWFLGSNKY